MAAMARGQISAELIIIIAAVLAVALIVVITLQQTAKEARGVVKSETSDIFKETKEITKPESKKLANGQPCTADADCTSNYCDPFEEVCKAQ
ncbi:MAG: class III signal peptide-containing protein [Candidatus Micrarchaeota archaeon]